MVLESGVRGPVPNGVVEPGRALECLPLGGQRCQAAGQDRLVGEGVRRHAAGAEFDLVPVISRDGDGVCGQMAGRDFKERRRTCEWYLASTAATVAPGAPSTLPIGISI